MRPIAKVIGGLRLIIRGNLLILTGRALKAAARFAPGWLLASVVGVGCLVGPVFLIVLVWRILRMDGSIWLATAIWFAVLLANEAVVRWQAYQLRAQNAPPPGPRDE